MRTSAARRLEAREAGSICERPTVVRFALFGEQPAPFSDMLTYGEQMRRAAMSRSQVVNVRRFGPSADASAVFSGRRDRVSFRRESHVHAHYLGECCRRVGSLSHITVFAHEGFSDDDLEALVQLAEKGGLFFDPKYLPPQWLVLVGAGAAEELGGSCWVLGRSPALATSATWVSRTPYVPARHLKVPRSQRNDPAAWHVAVRREVTEDLLRRPWLNLEEADAQTITVDLLPEDGTPVGGSIMTWSSFRRERLLGHGQRSTDTGLGLRITFPRLVRGPIAIGYASHFGLGQFWPEECVRIS